MQSEFWMEEQIQYLIRKKKEPNTIQKIPQIIARINRAEQGLKVNSHAAPHKV